MSDASLLRRRRTCDVIFFAARVFPAAPAPLALQFTDHFKGGSNSAHQNRQLRPTFSRVTTPQRAGACSAPRLQAWYVNAAGQAERSRRQLDRSLNESCCRKSCLKELGLHHGTAALWGITSALPKQLA
jgi:hypothetical protein